MRNYQDPMPIITQGKIQGKVSINSSDAFLSCSFPLCVSVPTFNNPTLTFCVLKTLEKLKITTKIYFSSNLGIIGKRTQRIINMLEHLDADTYLSPIGAAEYLESDRFSDLTTKKLEFQEFTSVPYPQHKNHNFQPFLSIIDIVANIGWESTKNYLKL